ncbi:hypothetical protein GCM10011575_28150 [Microlunatus endophyticus]|uniref:PH domain-containing protein n=1 Tax=Microlunatus endophyticus TaxID=1716077 RepID=A0A917W4U9_9ACTN|nr:hypothetical protein GCM10011575_28150 [Microlunatus endophyticus]
MHTDRVAINRRHGGILVAHGLLAALVVVAMIWISSLDAGPLSILPMLVLLVGQIFQLSYHSFVYGSRIAISEPLTIDGRGFAMNTAAGRMEVPWEAVTGVEVRRRLWNRFLVLRLHPAAQPGSPGVQTDLSARYWTRMQRYGGPMLGAVGIRESYDQIRQAVSYFSRGRVPVG